MKKLHSFLILLFLLPFMACSNATGQQTYPNQIPVKMTTADGKSILKNWSFVKSADENTLVMKKPDNPAFTGALMWGGNIKSKDPKEATLRALKLQGFQNGKVKAMREVNSNFVQQYDGHPNARVHVLIVDGQLSGKPARAAVYTWHGKTYDDTFTLTNVNIFMAPRPIFEALGGVVAPSVGWFDAVASPDINLLKFGQLSPDTAAKKMTHFFDTWLYNYLQINNALMEMMIGQVTASNQQLLNSMQSYNSALSQCGGWDCSISQGADGMWSATPD